MRHRRPRDSVGSGTACTAYVNFDTDEVCGVARWRAGAMEARCPSRRRTTPSPPAAQLNPAGATCRRAESPAHPSGFDHMASRTALLLAFCVGVRSPARSRSTRCRATARSRSGSTSSATRRTGSTTAESSGSRMSGIGPATAGRSRASSATGAELTDTVGEEAWSS